MVGVLYFVRMGLRYTSRLLMMLRDPLRSSHLYACLMDAVAEVDFVVGTCALMMSSIGEVVRHACCAVYESSVCVGECLVGW